MQMNNSYVHAGSFCDREKYCASVAGSKMSLTQTLQSGCLFKLVHCIKLDFSKT